ncbi:MAG: chromosomal replication initiator protein DnaA [Clostridia bacterium]|nr:chromosomal replication initiator protein DnaA [Clostridia bacterium]
MESLKDLWEQVCDKIKEEITSVMYNVWFDILEPVDFNGEILTLSVPTDFQRGIVEKNWMRLLDESVAHIIGYNCKINIVVKEEEKPEVKPVPLMNQFTFETFVVGPSNRFCHAAAKSVAENPGGKYNPLFIYGNPGLGKTHILNAIYNYVKDHSPHINIVLVRGEQFANEIIEAIHNHSTTVIRDKYRQADFLCIDDIHFIAGKQSTQEEFFNTFNVLYQDGKQIVVTSDRPPRDIQALEERIQSRLESGLLADLSPPDFETKVAVIYSKAELLGITVPENVAYFIADQIKNNFRQIEGIVKKLFAFQQITGEEPNIMLAQKAISEIRSDDATPVTIDKILMEVARTYNITREDILSKKQSKEISYARQVAIYVIREITNMPLLNIGKEVGGKDHATISYSLKKINQILDTNPKERATVNDIIKNINSL